MATASSSSTGSPLAPFALLGEQLREVVASDGRKKWEVVVVDQLAMHQVFPPLLVKHLYDFSKNSNKK
jgi:hypothetical protein